VGVNCYESRQKKKRVFSRKFKCKSRVHGHIASIAYFLNVFDFWIPNLCPKRKVMGNCILIL
jgi:hypothetical protein